MLVTKAFSDIDHPDSPLTNQFATTIRVNTLLLNLLPLNII
jgi:hypothetical protein